MASCELPLRPPAVYFHPWPQHRPPNLRFLPMRRRSGWAKFDRFRPLLVACRSSAGGDEAKGEDFVTRVLKDNPSQVEPKYLVGGRLYTLREKERLKKESKSRIFRVLERLAKKPVVEVGEEKAAVKVVDAPVHLNELLKEFKGKLYVPEEVFKSSLSEEEEFERNLEVLPIMAFDDFQKALKSDKVKLLTFRSDPGELHRDFVVDLKEIPGDKSLQKRKWVLRLDNVDARAVLEEYTGAKYEIERHTTSYVRKLFDYPHPVASSISSRIMVELAMVTSLIVVAATLLGCFMLSAVFAASSCLGHSYLCCVASIQASFKLNSGYGIRSSREILGLHCGSLCR